jgi:hypothetical protein
MCMTSQRWMCGVTCHMKCVIGPFLFCWRNHYWKHLNMLELFSYRWQWMWKCNWNCFPTRWALPHFSLQVHCSLNATFVNQWSGKSGPITHIPRRSALTSLNFFYVMCENMVSDEKNSQCVISAGDNCLSCSNSHTGHAFLYLNWSWILFGCLQGYKWSSHWDLLMHVWVLNTENFSKFSMQENFYILFYILS